MSLEAFSGSTALDLAEIILDAVVFNQVGFAQN